MNAWTFTGSFVVSWFASAIAVLFIGFRVANNEVAGKYSDSSLIVMDICVGTLKVYLKYNINK
jgi:hypothetical protein